MKHVVTSVSGDLWRRSDGRTINRLTDEEVKPDDLVIVVGKPPWWRRRRHAYFGRDLPRG